MANKQKLSAEEINAALGVTEEELDELARPYEEGTWQGTVSAIVRGRPRLSREDLQIVSFKLPRSAVKHLDRLAKQNQQTRSELLREFVEKRLRHGGSSVNR